MLRLSLTATVSFFVFVACNKTPDTPNTPPPPNPPVIDSTASDTVYLRKTQAVYFYYPSSLIIQDSNSTRWIYDNKRVIQSVYVYAHGQNIDSTTYTYSSTQTIRNSVT